MATQSQNFRNILRDKLEQIAKEEECDLSKSEHQGYIFAHYVSDLFMQWDVALEQDIEETLSRGPKDKQIDIILQDDDAQVIYILQAKCKGYGLKPKSIETDPARSFLILHDQLLDGTIQSKANTFVKDRLLDYKERVNNGWKVRYWYVTTEKIPTENDILKDYELKNNELGKGEYDIEFNIADTVKIQQIHSEILSYEESIPEEITIDIPAKLFVENNKATYSFIVGLLKGNSLRDQYNRKGRKDSLFAWNIRKYLGDRGINKVIRETADKQPEHFFYYNNGITAVCKDYQLDGNKLTIQKFQIINGAQTVASIAKSKPNDDLLVLFRLIKTGKVDTESGINREIIQANNTQNAIRLSDFRSNDPIQRWLEKKFNEHKKTEVQNKITYQAKRTGKKGKGRVLKLEEAAKIRYSFYNEPCTPHAEPKSLWILNSDKGHYSQSFGIEGVVEGQWSKDIFEEFLLAIAIHDRAEQEAKDLKKENPEYSFFLRLRFHVVSLAGIYIRAGKLKYSIHSILHSNDKFNEFWDTIWDEVRKIFYATHKNQCRREEKPVTLHAMVRSERTWENILDEFKFNMKIK